MTYIRDGVEYDNCIGCKKEIIATKSRKCLKCYESPTPKFSDDELSDARNQIMGLAYCNNGYTAKTAGYGRITRI